MEEITKIKQKVKEMGLDNDFMIKAFIEFREKHGRFPLLGIANLNNNGTLKHIEDKEFELKYGGIN